MPVKSFRGVMSDGQVETIRLATKNGSVGYKIKKLQLIFNVPGEFSTEHVVKVYKIPQASATGTIDFDDQTVLAAGYLTGSSSAGSYGNVGYDNIVFDNETFNQDIYVTHKCVSSTQKKVNYYIELEQIKLDLTENTVATLKDIRNIEASSV